MQKEMNETFVSEKKAHFLGREKYSSKQDCDTLSIRLQKSFQQLHLIEDILLFHALS